MQDVQNLNLDKSVEVKELKKVMMSLILFSPSFSQIVLSFMNYPILDRLIFTIPIYCGHYPLARNLTLTHFAGVER